MNLFFVWTVVLAIFGSSKISIAQCDDTLSLWYNTINRIKITNVGSYLSKTVIDTNSSESFTIHGNYVYWIDCPSKGKYEIKRANQDGSNFTTIVASDKLGIPTAITVDTVTGDIYYADSVGVWCDPDVCGNITVCANDGGNCRKLYENYVNSVGTIILHSQEQKLFWANRRGLPMIVAATMDGTFVKPIIVKDISEPGGLAIDFSSDRLYWSDGKLKSISSCNFDGTGRLKLIDIDSYQFNFAIAIYQDRIYYGADAKILSINKNTTKDEEPVVSDSVYNIQFPEKKIISKLLILV